MGLSHHVHTLTVALLLSELITNSVLGGRTWTQESLMLVLIVTLSWAILESVEHSILSIIVSAVLSRRKVAVNLV